MSTIEAERLVFKSLALHNRINSDPAHAGENYAELADVEAQILLEVHRRQNGHERSTF
jgi:hypothetical protein